MTLAHPSELFPFLRKLDAFPKRRLSQNFLIDANIVRNIISAAKIQPNDIVLEIGSGPGALTEALLNAGAHIIAIEKDTRFASALGRLDQDGRLTVYEADILAFDFNKLAGCAPLKIVANLPYHITSSILEKICAHSSLFFCGLADCTKRSRSSHRRGCRH